MHELFIPLLTGHLIGDFLLQTRWMVDSKKYVWVRLLHAAIVGAVTWALLGPVGAPAVCVMIAIVVLIHFLIDTIKGCFDNENVYIFIMDQAIHVLALLAIAALFGPERILSLWLRWIPAFYYVLVIAIGLILCIWFGGILMSKALQPMIRELGDKSSKGLCNGGKRIGQLERALTYLLVLSGNPGAIGFLFAAKSILRFGEIKEPGQRKEAEYIIIGTFASFGWALLVAVLTQRWLIWPR
ncbi:MAG TPA: DUF3307 domain-containing protein [Phycisphaerales bacterium]|nr:DUF3307 domain-containing protein [Phycisphaerales bacterium]